MMRLCLFVVGATALLPPVAIHPRAAKALPAKWGDSGPEKSATCVSKANQKPLTEYYSQREAEDAAEYAAIEYGMELEPYQCGRCQRWHFLQWREARYGANSLRATAKAPMAGRRNHIPDATRNKTPTLGARAASA